MSKIVGVEERRRHPRVKFESLVRVAGNGRKGRKAVGRDISFGGCSFYVDKSANWAKNEWIEIAVTPPEQFVDTIFDSRCKLKGRIAGTREWGKTDSGTDNEQCVAVEFEKDLRDVVREIYNRDELDFH